MQGSGLSFAENTAEFGAQGFTAIPAINAIANATGVRWVLVQTAGNLSVELADGTNNISAVIAVTAGQIFPLDVRRYTTGNTCVLLGLV